MTLDLAAVVGLETQVWEAMRRGDAAAEAQLLSGDFLGVYATGFAGRADHAAVLANGPAVADYELRDARLIAVTDDDLLLCYRADYRPVVAGAPAPAQSMYISSLWSRRAGEWVNTFSQDTPTA